ncbi:MAG: glycosyltransferase family 2 protein [Desulfobacteraceae bacterium]|nr:glycosyltransferase family 2 protein [Desulfobacteraceae bacterium]
MKDTNEMPLVSAIIPTYNRDWALKNAIDSALNQDYGNLEVIVIDDGSTDDTNDLLQQYKGKIVALKQTNKGVSAARNLGIQRAAGEYIALLDSDDAWEKEKISCQVRFFKENPKALICQTEEIWIRNGKRVNPRKKHKKPSGMIFEPSLQLCLVSPSSVMIKKELLDEKGLFNEAFPVCEDYDLWLRISYDTKIYLIDRPCTIKQGGHDDQLSSHHSQDKFRIQSLLNLMESNRLSQSQETMVKKVLKKKSLIYGNGCMKRGRTEEGEYYLSLGQAL